MCGIDSGDLEPIQARSIVTLKPSHLLRSTDPYRSIYKKKAGIAGFFEVLLQMKQLTGCPSAP
jgi:hypothetical protein